MPRLSTGSIGFERDVAKAEFGERLLEKGWTEGQIRRVYPEQWKRLYAKKAEREALARRTAQRRLDEQSALAGHGSPQDYPHTKVMLAKKAEDARERDWLAERRMQAAQGAREQNLESFYRAQEKRLDINRHHRARLDQKIEARRQEAAEARRQEAAERAAEAHRQFDLYRRLMVRPPGEIPREATTPQRQEDADARRLSELEKVRQELETFLEGVQEKRRDAIEKPVGSHFYRLIDGALGPSRGGSERSQPNLLQHFFTTLFSRKPQPSEEALRRMIGGTQSWGDWETPPSLEGTQSWR